MFADIKAAASAALWFYLVFLVIAVAVWTVLFARIWKEHREAGRRIQEQIIEIKRREKP